MEIKPVAIFRAPLPEKFGLPRQAGLAESLQGTVVLEPEFRAPEALRGMDGFDYLWLIWGFHLNKETASEGLTVRPPRLGGNERVGVFASRSPYRPNPLGLSSVRIERVDAAAGEIHVLGADLADGTPIYDIKPYLPYADCRSEATGGFAANAPEARLRVEFPEELLETVPQDKRDALIGVLSQDPRPSYHDDPARVYGMSFGGLEVRFSVDGGVLTVRSVNVTAAQ